MRKGDDYMASSLTEVDDVIVQSFLDNGILEDVEGHRLPQEKGVILVTCGDADHSYDIFTYHSRIIEDQCPDRRIHLCAWNGGALRLVPSSLSNNETPDAPHTFMKDVRGARALKGINTIALYCHIPCGQAGISGMHAQQIFADHVTAKQIIRKENPDALVACFVHIYRNGKRRSHFFNRYEWEQWTQACWPDIKKRYSLTV